MHMLMAPFAVALAMAPLAVAHAGPAAPRAEIAFANHGGVDDWRAVSDREIWFKDSHRRWFRAELMTPAFDLPFTEAIRIDARPSGTLDKWGGIWVRGQHYNFTSFERMPGPPPPRTKMARRH